MSLEAVHLAQIVDAQDVGVRHLSGEHDFALEPALHLLAAGRIDHGLGADDLERDGDAEFGVPRLVDRAHPPFAELPDDVIAAELLPGGQKCRS